MFVLFFNFALNCLSVYTSIINLIACLFVYWAILKSLLQFTFNKNGTIIFEATIRNRSQSASKNRIVSDDESLVKWIAVVEKSTNDQQTFSIYQPALKSPVPDKDMSLLPVDPATRRTYSRYFFLFFRFPPL